MQLLLSGATGLVGTSVMSLAKAQGDTVIAVGRRPTGMAAEEVITDFKTPFELPGADVAICALGTTIKAAGSKAAFYAIDHDAVLRFAEAARRGGINHFLVVTAMGAHAKSRVFYSRVKGEIEQNLEGLAFPRLDIAQPGLLLGERTERRPVERMLQAVTPLVTPFLLGSSQKYGSITATDVAGGLLSLCQHEEPGVFRHDNRALKNLCRTSQPI